MKRINADDFQVVIDEVPVFEDGEVVVETLSRLRKNKTPALWNDRRAGVFYAVIIILYQGVLIQVRTPCPRRTSLKGDRLRGWDRARPNR